MSQLRKVIRVIYPAKEQLSGKALIHPARSCRRADGAAHAGRRNRMTERGRSLNPVLVNGIGLGSAGAGETVRTAVIAILTFVVLTVSGCHDGVSPDECEARVEGRLSSADKVRVSSYLTSLPGGYPIAVIEKELGLPKSDDREAPTLHPYKPLWRVNYQCNNLLIGFDALDLSPNRDGTRLVYAGNPEVMTMAEYVRALRRIGVPPSTR